MERGQIVGLEVMVPVRELDLDRGKRIRQAVTELQPNRQNS
jgi:hypothetical protein